jgi:hypothetical protein
MHKWLQLISSKGGFITQPYRVGEFYYTTKTLFNYEKIITAMMHARDNDDADNTTSDEMTRKMGNMTNRETTHT